MDVQIGVSQKDVSQICIGPVLILLNLNFEAIFLVLLP